MTENTKPAAGNASGVLYVGPSLSRSLVGVALALATGRGSEGLEPEAPLSE